MDRLNSELKSQAIGLGLCADWTRLWGRGWSRDKMVERMYEGINFCMQNHWPDADYIAGNFEREFLRAKNIICNDEYSLLNPAQAFIAGESIARIRFNGVSSGEVYTRDFSHITLTAKGRAWVIIHAYDSVSLDLTAEDRARVTVIRHSPDIFIRYNGTVNIRDTKEKAEN